MSPRDISRRVLGRPLHSRYMPGGGGPSRARWLWLAPVAWLLWAGVISDHSMWRIWQLKHELVTARVALTHVKKENARLDARLHDPEERELQAETSLRQLGMSRPGEIIYRIGSAPADSAKGRSGAR